MFSHRLQLQQSLHLYMGRNRPPEFVVQCKLFLFFGWKSVIISTKKALSIRHPPFFSLRKFSLGRRWCKFLLICILTISAPFPFFFSFFSFSVIAFAPKIFRLQSFSFYFFRFAPYRCFELHWTRHCSGAAQAHKWAGWWWWSVPQFCLRHCLLFFPMQNRQEVLEAFSRRCCCAWLPHSCEHLLTFRLLVHSFANADDLFITSSATDTGVSTVTATATTTTANRNRLAYQSIEL